MWIIDLEKAAESLPTEETSEVNIDELDNCLLVDPTYNTPGPIDVMIGADIFPTSVKNGIKSLKMDTWCRTLNLNGSFQASYMAMSKNKYEFSVWFQPQKTHTLENTLDESAKPEIVPLVEEESSMETIASDST